MKIFCNEVDPYAARWLENLIATRHLPAGTVDDRSILDVEPDDLAGFRQCHFFAGIGGWPLALALAGWPDDREVWTGSCPCQPLSSAGQRRGHADERHLWPAFYALIAERRPATIFGEQVASKDGREWLSGVRADLEALGYAVGAADLCAAGVGAPHIRQRLFWVANSESCGSFGEETSPRAPRWRSAGSAPGGVADAGGNGREISVSQSGMARTAGQQGDTAERSSRMAWSDAIWLPCLDGKARRVEPAFQPLVDGFSGPRVGILRGAGNAIVPQVAAAFVAAVMEVAA